MSLTYREQVLEAVQHLRQKISFIPEVTILLGTGLGGLAAAVDEALCLPYESIPHFQKSTVESHKGVIVFGTLAGKKVAVLQGRLHFYEGYSTLDITFPVRVLALLGSSCFLVTNAAGGLNPKFQPGSLMTITDHLNFLPESPLRGENIAAWGPRFPDMSEVYDKELCRFAREAAAFSNVAMESGTYACVPGPCLETPAETRFYRNSGADAIGMSTVPEVLVAKHAGLRILGLSVLANINDPENFQPILLDEAIRQVQKAAPALQEVVMDVLKRI
jgi:purine-nucleoside phosphorylase